MNIAQFLKERGVAFDVVRHRETFTAADLATVMEIPSSQVAKTVLLRADHGYRHFVVVMPAGHRIDFPRLSRALGGSQIELASEQCLAEHCPDCERGVLPPFGSQYGMRTVVDSALLAAEQIIFEANTHSEAIRMKLADYLRIEQPLVIPITTDSFVGQS
ncbi:MAG TPA: YbaK/EbsC family protein [Pirellulaceae bacterium]|nr:YbaK/EbsC family protein [Pirellulaceae bacterium]